jgi:hypothetical protein
MALVVGYLSPMDTIISASAAPVSLLLLLIQSSNRLAPFSFVSV